MLFHSVKINTLESTAAEFWPYGTAYGDISMDRNDDGSEDYYLSNPPFTFFGTGYNHVFVSSALVRI